jgi:hypothetical protein
MAKQIRKCKCKNCRAFFLPDPRNAWHQQYCSEPECRKASKAASQKKWLMKEENRHYFRGPLNVQRVQQWRSNHPGYWRRRAPQEPEPLQDVLLENSEENQTVETPKTSGQNSALQELLNAQDTVLIGLIAHLTGSALQDDIAFTTRRLQQLGTDIVNGLTQTKGENHDPKASRLAAENPKDPQPVQLGGSAVGP